jgi:hypothetical protein
MYRRIPSTPDRECDDQAEKLRDINKRLEKA